MNKNKKIKKMSDHEEYYFEKETNSIEELEEDIEYKKRRIEPELPEEPNGFLYGVGFIFDEDCDLRVLVAINKLINDCFVDVSKEDIIAVAEHEGVLKIYSIHPIHLEQLGVCGDVWQIESYVPYMGKWVKIDKDFMISCARHILASQRFFKID